MRLQHGAVNTTKATLIQPQMSGEDTGNQKKKRNSSQSTHPVEPYSFSYFSRLDVKGMNRFPTFIEERGGAKPAG